MIKIEDDCCDCGFTWKCGICQLKAVEHRYCDKCGEEMDYDDVYTTKEYDDLCLDCLREMFAKEVEW